MDSRIRIRGKDQRGSNYPNKYQEIPREILPNSNLGKGPDVSIKHQEILRGPFELLLKFGVSNSGEGAQGGGSREDLVNSFPNSGFYLRVLEFEILLIRDFEFRRKNPRDL